MGLALDGWHLDNDIKTHDISKIDEENIKIKSLQRTVIKEN